MRHGDAPSWSSDANGRPYAHSTSSTVKSPRERFLDQLLLAAEVIIEQRDVRFCARRNRSMRQRLEAVLGNEPLDRVEQATARIVPATALGPRGCVRSDGADCMFQGHGGSPHVDRR